MIEVKNRSVESWVPLAACGDKQFKAIVDQPFANDAVKKHLKKAKKLKTYKVTFIKTWESDTFELQAESDWDISAVAREYWNVNEGNIGFKEKPRGQWADSYKGYDSIQYVKVRNR